MNAPTIAEEGADSELMAHQDSQNMLVLNAMNSNQETGWVSSNQDFHTANIWLVDQTKKQNEQHKVASASALVMGSEELKNSRFTIACASVNTIGSCLQVDKNRNNTNEEDTLVLVELPNSEVTYDDYARPLYRKDIFLAGDPNNFTSSQVSKGQSGLIQSNLSILLDPTSLLRSQNILNTLTRIPLPSELKNVQANEIAGISKFAERTTPFEEYSEGHSTWKNLCVRFCLSHEQSDNTIISPDDEQKLDQFAERLADSSDLGSVLDAPTGQKESSVLRPFRRKLRLWKLTERLKERDIRRQKEYQQTLVELDEGVKTTEPETTFKIKNKLKQNRFCIPWSMSSVLKTMFNFSLLTRCDFLVIALANTLKTFGGYAPTMFYSQFAVIYNFPEENKTWPMSAFGLGSMFSRLFFSFISDILQISPLYIVTACCISWATVFAILPFLIHFIPFTVMMGLFGASLGPPIAFTTLIICEFLGLDNLTNAIGIVTLCRGISYLFGSPLAADLIERNGDFVAAYYMVGVIPICLCFICYVFLCLLKRRRDSKTKQDTDLGEQQKNCLLEDKMQTGTAGDTVVV